MDFDAYARTAVDIVNTPLDDTAGLIALFDDRGWLDRTATDRDLATLRRGQKRLREVFEHGSAGRPRAAVAELNALLEQHPIRPRISGHDSTSHDSVDRHTGGHDAGGRDTGGHDAGGRDAGGPARHNWHMHVTGRGTAASSELLAGAVWGLAVWLCEHGSSRFGVCADDRCGNVYLDTSSNCCRRFCSERCATRSHVAAHRARKRAAGPDTPADPSVGCPPPAAAAAPQHSLAAPEHGLAAAPAEPPPDPDPGRRPRSAERDMEHGAEREPAREPATVS